MYNLIPVRSSRMNAVGWNEDTMYIQFRMELYMPTTMSVSLNIRPSFLHHH